MELFLLRHADALPGTNDFERELSPLGHQQAGKIAEWFLENAGPECLADLQILVSPSIRTRQTVSYFRKEENGIQLCMPLYENTSPKEILDILGWPDISIPTLIVGHQPLMGFLADRLLAGKPHPESFRKGALWRLQFEPGKKNVRLVSVTEP